MKGIIERLLSTSKAREIIKDIVMETLSERMAEGKPLRPREPGWKRIWRRNVEDWRVIPDEADGEGYLNTRQTAKLLGIPYPNVSKLRDSGLLRACRRAGYRMPLYRREDVLALKERREAQRTAPEGH